MAVTALIRPQGARLIAANPAAELAIADMKSGVWMAEIRQPRNQKRHRFYWALCGLVAKCMNDGPSGNRGWTAEGVDTEVRIATGYCKAVQLPQHLVDLTGHHVGVNKTSISFSAMDDDAFSAFMNDAVRFVSTSLAPWMPKNNWRAEIASMARMEGDE